MDLIIDRPSEEGLYYYKGCNFRGCTVTDLITWIQEGAANCMYGDITFTTLSHGFEMDKIKVSYADHAMKEEVPDTLKKMRVVLVRGYGGYGGMSLDVDIASYAEYLMYYEDLPEPLTPWDRH